MGQGLQRVAKQCGGLIVEANGKRVRYNAAGRIVKREYVFKRDDIVYHRYRGRGIFRHFCTDHKESFVLLDQRDAGVSAEGERVTTDLLSKTPHRT